jgi:hypothetical protein
MKNMKNVGRDSKGRFVSLKKKSPILRITEAKPRKKVEAKGEAKPEAKPVAKKVSKKAEKAAGAPAIEILKATYGIGDVRVEVTDRVKIGRKVSNRMVGEDPVPGTAKEMVIEANVNGKKVTKTFAEKEVVEF